MTSTTTSTVPAFSCAWRQTHAMVLPVWRADGIVLTELHPLSLTAYVYPSCLTDDDLETVERACYEQESASRSLVWDDALEATAS